MKNLLNRALRFLLRGILIQVDITDPNTGKTTRISRYVGREAFHLLQARAQQELRQMHQAALKQQVEAARDAKK